MSVIDLDTPAVPAVGRRRPARRAVASAPGRAGRVLALVALALAAPPSAPSPVTAARTIPLPSYCTGRPIPGGRLNIVEHGRYIILDATTNTVVGSGACPR
ncbi:hypothetical protein ACFFX1_07375 [Dactylosporangium sucinum]|uniref:Uncharacterized protein n=1 Tax=Dactylosporangium sucinum TaxID=1424081 RepID=A0A917U9S8_9ACTN|nr:hypothetical protein [Dactylosporangium sucinum]GGM70100.1 hypothetical protein GCM10007977_084870 [Dactylosporangium sucinum]